MILKHEQLMKEVENLPLKWRKVVCKFLDGRVPDSFRVKQAGSIGEYHPKHSEGEGGLLRHTKTVACIAADLLRLEKYADADAEVVIISAVLHDTFKYKEDGSNVNSFHPLIAADNWKEFCEQEGVCDTKEAQNIYECIYWHMFDWTPAQMKIDRHFPQDELLVKAIEVVQMSDYFASGKVFDIFD